MSEWIKKLKGQLTSRKLLFVGAGLLVVVFVMRGCSGVDISQEEAVANATAAFEAQEGYFEPEETRSQSVAPRDTDKSRLDRGLHRALP